MYLPGIGIGTCFVRGSGEAAYVAPLDLVAQSASVALGLRKLRSAYSGSAVRIRRSGDNAESDFGFVGGDFDSASATAFCIAGGGAQDGFIVTWYDQSPAGVNYTQATAAQQVKIIAGGVIYTNGTNAKSSVLASRASKYIRASNLTLSTSMSIFSCAKWTAKERALYGGTITDSVVGFLTGANTIYVRTTSGSEFTFTDTINNNRIYSFLNNGGGSNACVFRSNGSAIFTGTNNVTFQANVFLSGYNSSDYYRFEGYAQEYIAYNSYVSDFALIESNQNTYYGYY